MNLRKIRGSVEWFGGANRRVLPAVCILFGKTVLARERGA
jgi:hypothetical protein